MFPKNQYFWPLNKSESMNKATPAGPTVSEAATPWWHFGHVWLVIAGPAVVVVAAFVTLWLAIKIPDPVVADDYYKRGMEINKTLADQGTKALLPALQGRNHAATPSQDLPPSKP
jgi:hypothetical protein